MSKQYRPRHIHSLNLIMTRFYGFHVTRSTLEYLCSETLFEAFCTPLPGLSAFQTRLAAPIESVVFPYLVQHLCAFAIKMPEN